MWLNVLLQMGTLAPKINQQNVSLKNCHIHYDNYFCIFRMANTKKSPRKQGKIKCHVSFVEFDTEEAWEAHIVQSAKTKRDWLVYSYSAAGCNYLSQRRSDYNRHYRRKHGLVGIDSDSDWEKCNPGSLSDIIGDPTSTSGNETSVIKKKTPNTTKCPKGYQKEATGYIG